MDNGELARILLGGMGLGLQANRMDADQERRAAMLELASRQADMKQSQADAKLALDRDRFGLQQDRFGLEQDKAGWLNDFRNAGLDLRERSLNDMADYRTRSLDLREQQQNAKGGDMLGAAQALGLIDAPGAGVANPFGFDQPQPPDSIALQPGGRFQGLLSQPAFQAMPQEAQMQMIRDANKERMLQRREQDRSKRLLTAAKSAREKGQNKLADALEAQATSGINPSVAAKIMDEFDVEDHLQTMSESGAYTPEQLVKARQLMLATGKPLTNTAASGVIAGMKQIPFRSDPVYESLQKDEVLAQQALKTFNDTTDPWAIMGDESLQAERSRLQNEFAKAVGRSQEYLRTRQSQPQVQPQMQAPAQVAPAAPVVDRSPQAMRMRFPKILAAFQTKHGRQPVAGVDDAEIEAIGQQVEQMEAGYGR